MDVTTNSFCIHTSRFVVAFSLFSFFPIPNLFSFSRVLFFLPIACVIAGVSVERRHKRPVIRSTETKNGELGLWNRAGDSQQRADKIRTKESERIDLGP